MPTVDDILEEINNSPEISQKKWTINDLRAAQTKEEMRAVAFWLVKNYPFDDNLLLDVMREVNFFLTHKEKGEAQEIKSTAT